MDGTAPRTRGTTRTRRTTGRARLVPRRRVPAPFSAPHPGTQSNHAGTAAPFLVGLLLAVLLFAGLFLSDLLTPATFRPHTLLVLVPIATALFAPFAVTAVSVAVAVVLTTVLKSVEPSGLAFPDTLVVAACSVLALLVAAVREREHRRFDSVSEVAEAAQRTVMRRMPARIGTLHVAGAYRPAVRSAHVGGDWFDVQPSPFGLRAVLGDVSGHGLPAVGASGALLGEFRSSGYFERDLREVGRRLEIRMRRRSAWARSLGDSDEQYSTALLLEFGEAHVRVLGFGHDRPLMIRGGEVTEVPVEPALPLGLGALSDEPPPEPVRVPFEPGDTLVLFTDGVTECRDARGRFYPLRERLARFAARCAGPEDLRDALSADVEAFRGGRPVDDTALMVITRTPAGVNPYAPQDRYLYTPETGSADADSADPWSALPRGRSAPVGPQVRGAEGGWMNGTSSWSSTTAYPRRR